MIPVAAKPVITNHQLRHLQGRAPVPVFPYKSRVIPLILAYLGMGKVKDIGPAFMHQHIGMGAHGAIIRPFSRLP